MTRVEKGVMPGRRRKMVGERGSPGCDVMATLPRVATPQKGFVLHADSQVWEADAERKQVCISDSHTHTYTPISFQEKGLGTLGWKQRTSGGAPRCGHKVEGD